jgi:hypothetical protein
MLALLMASLVFAPPQTTPADSPSSSSLDDYLKRLGYETVEFEDTDHTQDFVVGALSTGGKHTFLVDTGWGMTSLSKAAAKGIKRPAQESYQASGTSRVEFVKIDELTLGHVHLTNQPARVEDLRADYIHLPFDAVLGCDFFFRNSCLIDCYKRRLYLHNSPPSEEQTRALEETLRLSGFAEVPIESQFLLTVQAEINGRPVRLGLDTGASFDQLDDSELKLLGLTTLTQASAGSLIPGELGAHVIGVGSIGGHEMKATRPTTFRVGTREWKRIYFGVLDLKPWNLAKPGTPGERVKGLLCQTTLEFHGALIDFAHQKLWLRPEKLTP